MRLLDVGCGWGGMVRHAAEHYGVRALGVTLSREQASWAQERIKARRPRPPRRGAPPRLPGRPRDRLRRGQRHRADRAHRGQELPGLLRVPARQAAPRRPAAQPRHHPSGQPARRSAAARLHRPLRLPRRRAHRVGRHRHARSRTPTSRCSTTRTCGCTTPARWQAWCANLVDNWDECVAEAGLRDRQGVGPLHGRLPAGVRAQRHPAAPDPGHAHRGERRSGYPLRHDFGV